MHMVNVLKFQTLFYIYSQIKVFSQNTCQMANLGHPDQTASEEAVWSGSALFVKTFLEGN